MDSTDCEHAYIASVRVSGRQGDSRRWECEDCQQPFGPVSPVEATQSPDMGAEVRRALALPDEAPMTAVLAGIKHLTREAALKAGAFPCRMSGTGHDEYVHQHDGVWYLPYDPNYVEVVN